MSTLTKIKLFHTFIWFIEAVAILYLLVTGIIGVQNLLVIIAFLLVVLEVIVLLIYKWRCPLTIVAEKHSDDPVIGFDIYLPPWFAKHNKTIFGTIFALATIIHLIRII
jgi:hypothetical protein